MSRTTSPFNTHQSLVDEHSDDDDEGDMEYIDIGDVKQLSSSSNGSFHGKISPPSLIPSANTSSHSGSGRSRASSNADMHKQLSTIDNNNNNTEENDSFLSQAALARLEAKHNSNNNSSNNSQWRRNDISISTSLSSSNYYNPQLSNNKTPPTSSITPNSTTNNNNTHSTNSILTSTNAIQITPLHQIPYVHGGYAAAAPLFVTHSTKFASILKKLLPGAYSELSVLLRREKKIIAQQRSVVGNGNGNNGNASRGRNGANGNGNGACSPTYTDVSLHSSTAKLHSSDIRKSEGKNLNKVILPDPVKIMKWAENNPVVSAFGIWNSDSGRRTIKFMQGVQLLHQPIPLKGNYNNNNIENTAEDDRQKDDDDRQSFISGYTESVVTIGTNGNNFGYRNSMMGYQPQQRAAHSHYHYGRPKRRKQPEPEDGTQLETIEGSGSNSSHNTPLSPRPIYNKPALEWDVFLDPNIVRQVDQAMGVVDNLDSKLRKVRVRRERKVTAAKLMMSNKQKQNSSTNSRPPYRRSLSSSSNTRVVGGTSGTNKVLFVDDIEEDNEDEDEDENDDDFDILQSHTAAQVEVDRLVSQLMRRTIIAHGSMSQLVLEAMGVAPKYNFGRVVKNSRSDNHHQVSPTRSPSRSMRRLSLKAGNAEFSINMTQTFDSIGEDEEQRDFEALLDPSVLNDTPATATKDGGRTSDRQRNRTHEPSSSSSSSGSKGMFIETWLHVFARTLSLLVKSSSKSGCSGEEAAQSSSASNASSGGGSSKNQQRLLVQARPANIGQRGLSGLLEKVFLRKETSAPATDATVDEKTSNELVDYEDDNSELLTNSDMFSPSTTNSTSTFGAMCGMTLCLGMDDNTGGGGGRGGYKSSSSTFPLNPHASHKMAHDIEKISSVLGEPLRLVLDLKSRRVPCRVWSRLIDSLRTRGLIVEGIGSFDMDELRVIGKGCSYPVTPMLFFHSVGDLQRACHANEVKNGDTVYFNGGSLMWKRSSIMEAAERGCCGTTEGVGDDDITAVAAGDGVTRSPKVGSSGNYSFQPYAYPRSALSDWERTKVKATIEDYRRHFNLKIGVYVQEFSISAEALDALSKFINKHGNIYDQGLAFGGINGAAVRNINGDGYWNQRYMGRAWDMDARPSKEMTPLKPEDHHLVQKAIQAGAWGQVGTIYEVMDEQAGALTVLPPP